MPRTPNSPPEMPTMHLVLDDIGAVGVGLALAGIAVLHRPDHLAGLGVERDERGVGLMQEDLAVAHRRRRG